MDPGDPVSPLEFYEGTVRTQLPRWQGWAKAARELDEIRKILTKAKRKKS